MEQLTKELSDCRLDQETPDQETPDQETLDSDRVVYIMRGLPGSGKSTRARLLIEEAKNGGNGDNRDNEDKTKRAIIHSTDDYFLQPDPNDPDKLVYCFNLQKLGSFHNKNYQAFCRSIDEGIEVVIVDNTNIKRSEFKRYRKRAEENGYRVEEIVVGEFTPEAVELYAARGLHRVPKEVIASMASKFHDA
jgi:tRNA uridine 5-carbamoylmethylation protein Kti12